jgi:hypothetical protein
VELSKKKLALAIITFRTRHECNASAPQKQHKFCQGAPSKTIAYRIAEYIFVANQLNAYMAELRDFALAPTFIFALALALNIFQAELKGIGPGQYLSPDMARVQRFCATKTELSTAEVLLPLGFTNLLLFSCQILLNMTWLLQ